MPVCSRTGLTRPECSCPLCFEQQLREYQPGLLTPGEPEIRIRRTLPAPEPGAGKAPPRD
jgi:hypothetical protein